MVIDNPNIFADQQQFEAYYQSVMDRLEAEYRERVTFLTEGLERLRNLQRMAEALHDEEMQRDLDARVSTAQAELQALETALAEGRPLAGDMAEAVKKPARSRARKNGASPNGTHGAAVEAGEVASETVTALDDVVRIPVAAPSVPESEPQPQPELASPYAETPVEPLFAQADPVPAEPATPVEPDEIATPMAGAVPDWAASLWSTPAAAEPQASAAVAEAEPPTPVEPPAPAGFEWSVPGTSPVFSEAPVAEAPAPPSDPFVARAEPVTAAPVEKIGVAADCVTAETAIVPDAPTPHIPAGSGGTMDWDLGFREQAPAWGRPAPPELAPTNDTATGALHLHITLGERTFNWSLAEANAILGRRDPATGRVPDLDLWPDTAVSRRHARITYRTGRYYLTDLGSTNGTEVNGRELRQQSEQALNAGDEILMGEKTRIQVTQAP
jgi:hypothetical protein